MIITGYPGILPTFINPRRFGPWQTAGKPLYNFLLPRFPAISWLLDLHGKKSYFEAGKGRKLRMISRLKTGLLICGTILLLLMVFIPLLHNHQNLYNDNSCPACYLNISLICLLPIQLTSIILTRHRGLGILHGFVNIPGSFFLHFNSFNKAPPAI